MSIPTYKLRLSLVTFFTASVLASFAQTPAPIPSGYTGPVNYVRVWEPVKPYTSVSDVINTSRITKEVKQTTQYFDGLGRPIQTVVKNGSLDNSTNPSSPLQRDMVTPVVYDEFGREQLKYLPYASASATDGNFKTDPFTEQVAFYNTQLNGQTGETNISGRNWAYSKTNFEASPLNRVNEAYAPGASWVGSEGGSTPHPVKMKYWINTVNDAVRIWNVTDVANGFGTYATTATYPAGELYKNVTEDEHGKQVIEFKDKEGKVVLKKVQLTASAETDGTGSNHSGWICTYYIYDDLNNLRAVIQPEGVKTLAQYNWDFSQVPTSIGGATTLLNEQTFRYEYDHRNRMTMKKVPGAGEVYMVYDARDRLVMTQDANMRTSGKWMVTIYDVLNRPVETGLVLNSWFGSNKTFAQHRTDAGSSTEYPFPPLSYPVGSNWEELTKTGYDNYSTLPSVGLSSTYLTTWDGNFAATSTNWPYPQMPDQSNAVTGMVTWTKVKVLNSSSDYIYTVMIYDDKGRVIQAQSKSDVTGGVDVVTTQYSWIGQPLVMVQKQQITGTNAQTHTLVTKMDYDELGRVKEVKKKINTDTEKIIAKNEYDKLGQLKNKKLATYYSGGFIENLSYDYNIRGWMLGMNRSYLNTDNSTKFGFELSYDKKKSAFDNNSADTYAGYQFNGNIAGMMWRSMGDGQKRKYDFDYDAVNRLSKADFTQYNSGWNVSAGVDFSVGGSATNNNRIAYDDNGNIKEMWQKGLKLNSSEWIDQMRYTYIGGTNKLKSVTDFTNDVQTKLGDFKTATTHSQSSSKTALTSSSSQSSFDAITDYSYDVNGNLTLDHNKGIASITYNHLNLPQTVTVTGKGTITYTYDAGGNKLRKTTVENNVSITYNNQTASNTITTTTEYVGNLVYESKTYSVATGLNYTNKLQFAGQEEGRIRALYADAASTTITGYAYDYMIKDHLGNVRMVLTDEVTTNYYPAATLEGTYGGSPEANSMVNQERKYYNIDQSKITAETSIPSWGTETTGNTKLYYNHNDIPPASPNPNYPASVSPTPATGSTQLYKLNASTNKTGLEFVMKVMAGDKVDILGKSYYLNTTNVSNSNSTTMDLLGMFTSLLLAPVNGIGAKGITATQLQGWNNGLVPSSFFRGDNNETGTAVPKAYINYIFLDEQFKFVSGSASRVGTSGTVKNHWNDDAQLQNINVSKNGYLFVYVSNESNFDVFFDNLQVVHKPGPVIEETHYYPFGLTMQGISSQSANSLENKFKYNKGSELQSKEFSDGSGLDWYGTFFRMYDPQIGRWHVVDPKPKEAFSLYVGMDNNPILYNDPLGDRVPVAGEKEDKKELVKQINEATGGNYKINKKGELKARGGKYGNTETGKLFKQAIKAKHDIGIHAVSNDKETFFDSYASTKVDVGDIKQGDATFKKGIYAHFMAERLAAGERYSDAKIREEDMSPTEFGGLKLVSKFDSYHNTGLQAESRAIAESIGVSNLPIRLDPLIQTSDQFGVSTFKGATFKYGSSVQYRINTSDVLTLFPESTNIFSGSILSIIREK